MRRFLARFNKTTVMQNILTTLIEKQALKYGDREALSYLRQSVWTPISWNELHDETDFAAYALEILDVKAGDKIAVFSGNRPQMIALDFAAFYNRAVPVSIYSTSTSEQVKYIVDDAAIEIIFAGDQTQYAIARDVQRITTSLRMIVTFDEVERDEDDTTTMTYVDFIRLGMNATVACHQEVEKRRAASAPEDIAAIIYTSGTTGEPKGAVLPHSCFNAAMEIHRERLTMLSDRDTSVCFLPLSHIFERAWTYFCLYTGMKVSINYNPHDIQTTVYDRKPTCMCSVPRFWEKVYTAVQEKIAEMGAVQRAIAHRALKIGRRRNLDYARLGKKAPWWLEAQYRFYDSRVFAPMRRVIGISHGNIFPTAGAPLSPTIVEFFHSCGINVMIGYGLSETTATVTCFPIVGYEIGTVGTVMPRVQMKIGDNSEILVKGPTVTSGYYRKPQATAEAFTSDGWFRTGDAGYIDASGALVLTERLKDLFKTSNGKYIAPQALESRLGEDKYIEQVAVIGDRRKYVTAIIVPSFPALKEYAAKNNISYGSMEELVTDPEIVAMLTARIDRLQSGFASFERIKKFTLLPQPFTLENGELTNTLKIKRPVINTHYSREIDAMYE